MKGKKISCRLTDSQLLVLDELKGKLGVSYSLLIRAIVLDFLTRNEDALERIIAANIEEDESICQ